MTDKIESAWLKFIAEHWVSWLIELTVMCLVADFTIAETRKTAEQTRQMLSKYDAAISKYAAEKSEVVDAAASAAVEKIKQKADGVTKENVVEVLQSLKKSKEPKVSN